MPTTTQVGTMQENLICLQEVTVLSVDSHKQTLQIFFSVHVENLESKRDQEQKEGRLTTFTTGTALGVLDAQRYTPQHRVTALE